MRTRCLKLLCCGLLLTAPAYAGRLSPSLEDVLRTAGPADLVPVTIVLDRQLPPFEARTASSLMEVARSGQRMLLDRLREASLIGAAARVRSLWLVSVIGAELTPALIAEIAEREDVRRVNHDPPRAVFLGATSSVECGTDLIRAPEVWNDLGVRGEGAVIAVIDTGVCYFHPDIRRQIWVNPGEDLDRDGAVMDTDDLNGIDDDGNGYADDLIGWDFAEGDNDPKDGDSHGSHVAGTVAGDGASGTQSGVAPAARVMVLRVGSYYTDELDVWQAMEYAAANGADVMSMSLGWPHEENPDRATWRDAAENAIELGTTIVVSAGNEGSGNAPDNVRTPGDVPRVITAGATDCADALAGFSSQGPVGWQNVAPYFDHPYPPGLVKPDVSAPGVDTLSHSLCAGYTLKSGTSMSAPHISGTVALMVSADPTLSHDEIKSLLETHAVDLGPPGKDNQFGAGRIDAFETVQSVVSPIVYDAHTLDDSRPEHGNDDGDIDTGEIVTVAVTLRDREGSGANGVWASLSTEHPGVEILDAVALYPDVPPWGTATSVAPHYTVRLRAGCGNNVRFLLTIGHDDGSFSYSRLSLRSGLRQTETFLDDDMEADRGWSSGGTETTNAFVREDPNEMRRSGTVIQPEDDTTPFPGTTAWVTGNPSSSTDPLDGEVDKVAWLDSPLFDASGGDELYVDFSRWIYIGEQGLGDNAYYSFEVSNDGGAGHTVIEQMFLSDPGWNAVSFPIGLAPTDQMQIRFRAVDEEGPIGTPGDALVEALIDDVTIHGARYLCDAVTPPPGLAPNPVGNTLTAGKHPAGTRLAWAAPPVDAGHDGARTYQVHRSGFPSGDFLHDRDTTATVSYDPLPVGPGEARFYLVVSENGGGTSGEEP